MSQKTQLEVAAAYWNSIKPTHGKARWWQWPRIISFQNELVCGKPLEGWNAGLIMRLKERLGGRVLKQGVSIGCGNGSKEMALVQAGVVESFDLFEISDVRMKQGRELHARHGLQDRMRWHTKDGLAHLESHTGSYDLVFWDNSLHHMMDTTRAVLLSYRALSRGGFFAMNDFVGATRFQWSERTLQYGSFLRASLPQHYLRKPSDPSKQIPRVIVRPNFQRMIETDPSEAADSDNIIPAIKKHLPNPTIWNVGGAIYHIGLSDVLANFDAERDAGMFEAVLVLERALIELGEEHYSVCLSQKV